MLGVPRPHDSVGYHGSTTYKKRDRFAYLFFHDGVVIIFKVYKRKNLIGTARRPAEQGDVMLHQILNTNPGSKKAGKVLQAFFKLMDAPVWLTVRKNNSAANKFYLRNGMRKVGTTSWMNGKMLGLVFRHDP